MTEQQKNNHWDELVDDLGVDATSHETKQTGPSASESDPETPPDFDVIQSKSSMSSDQSPGWDDLATGLGITASEPSRREEKPQTVAPARSAVPAEKRDEPKTDLDTESDTAESDTAEFEAGDRSGAESTASTDETSKPGRRRRRGRGRRRPTEDAAEGQAEIFSLDVDDIESAVDFEPATESEEQTDVTAVEETSDEQERRPRRRRRRGRRGSRRGEASAEESKAADKSPAESELDEEADIDAFDDDESDESTGESHDDDTSSPSQRSKHRNIPTWQEAVGVVVDSNIESRSKSAKSSGRGRGRGRGKGKGRGRPGRGRGDG